MAFRRISRDQWRISDDDWAIIERVLPTENRRLRGGRPSMPRRQAMEAILFVLQTGCKWKTLPREFGASSTVYGHFQEWLRADVFVRLVELGILPIPGHIELRRRQRVRTQHPPKSTGSAQPDADLPTLAKFFPMLPDTRPDCV